MPQPDNALSTLLDRMTALYLKYVTFTEDSHAFICALWCAQTWLFRAKEMHGITSVGYLAFISPTKNCGKSNALTVTAALSYGQPKLKVSPTSATIFRPITKERTTIILDELDNLIEANNDITAILNAGYKKDTVVERMGGKNRDILMRFETFCPKAIAYKRDSDSLKLIQDTLESRCIRILLKRRTLAERDEAAKLTSRRLHVEADPLAAKLAEWQFGVPDLEETGVFDAVDLKGIDGREQECWDNLWAVAYLAGRLREAQEAALALMESNREEAEDQTNTDVPLLRDIAEHLERMCDGEGFSTELASSWLTCLPDRQYGLWNRGRGLSRQALAHILAKYGLRSRPTGRLRLKRISRRLVEDVLKRHLPAEQPDDRSKAAT